MMTSPLSRISAGSFFSGLTCEYSSLGWPGTTVAGRNSILSIRPSSIAAMRTLRAKGEAGEKLSFIWMSFENTQKREVIRHCERSEAIRSHEGSMDCFVACAPRNDDLGSRL